MSTHRNPANEPLMNLCETATGKIEAFIVARYPRAASMGIAVDDPLLEKGIIDSVGILLLVNFIEETFGVLIAEEDLDPDNFVSIRTISRFIESKQVR